jgi:hypothetical protein
MKYSDEKDMQNFKKVDVSSWDGIKDSVFVRLINNRYLDQYGKDIVYIKKMDLAMVFSVQEKVKDVILSYLLTNKDLENMGVELSTVKEIAVHNSSHDRKRRIMTFKENVIMSNLMYPVLQIPKGMMMGAGGNSPSECGIIQDVDEANGCDNILILCNKHNAFGSSYMVLPSVLDEVYNRFNQENFYIIPLSIHQVMCIRSGYATHDNEKPRYEVEDDLLDMIEQFNDTNNKSWKNILSYKIYYYYGDDGKKLFLIK